MNHALTDSHIKAKTCGLLQIFQISTFIINDIKVFTQQKSYIPFDNKHGKTLSFGQIE